MPSLQAGHQASNLHSGGGQVGVLVLQSPVQRQASLLLVVSQQGGDGQGVFIGAAGLHCLAVKEIKSYGAQKVERVGGSNPSHLSNKKKTIESGPHTRTPW